MSETADEHGHTKCLQLHSQAAVVLGNSNITNLPALATQQPLEAHVPSDKVQHSGHVAASIATRALLCNVLHQGDHLVNIARNDVCSDMRQADVVQLLFLHAP